MQDEGRQAGAVTDDGEPSYPWVVAPNSGFRVASPDGRVGLRQIDAANFLVSEKFAFYDRDVVADLLSKVPRERLSPEQVEASVLDARTFTPSESPTDIASIPRYLRWFENSYGPHTLAAIIHDRLIVEKPNEGALKSDTLSDRFFRQMLASAGVPWLKRWIMWTAVALRSRFAAGGLRRAAVLVWLVLAVSGIGAFVCVLGQWFDLWVSPIEPAALLVYAVAMPLVTTQLWGRQWAASLIAAIAALWVLPAAAFAVVGFVIYRLLEFGAQRFGLR